MSSVIHNVPDVTTFSANIVVVLAAIAAAVAGAMSAAKTIKKAILENMKPEESSVTKTQVIGGLLQDTFGSAMLADALKDNRETNEDLRHAVCALRDEMREARHMLERVNDAVRSQNNVR